ncbi:MAG: hypothetical protein QNJ90_01625 [Planctomycetota bacterium]|nr:hypothetical protein [Planctomycetota bacterium]
MPRSKIPTALQMRELKYGDTSEADRDRMAQELRAAGRRAEAILLFEGRGDHAFLREEADWAVSEGNGFHLVSILRLGREVPEEELRACARAAETRGRWMDARLCYLELDDEGAIRAIAEHLPAALQPEAPEEPTEPEA